MGDAVRRARPSPRAVRDWGVCRRFAAAAGWLACVSFAQAAPPVTLSELGARPQAAWAPAAAGQPARRAAASGAAESAPPVPAHMPFYVATRGAQTIYLLGTLHIGDPDDFPPKQPFRPAVLEALAHSPVLALELSPDDMTASQQQVSRYGVCARPCLQRMLPAPLWNRLRRRLRGNPAALAAVRDMHPWLAALVIETYDTLQAGLQNEYGTEAQLQNIYLHRRGGSIVGLETLDEQVRAFTSLTPAQEREMLSQDLMQTPAQNAADVRELHRLWRIGDADALAAWATAKAERLTRDRRASAAIDEQILYARDGRFVSRMIERAAPGRPVFVAIGALHLGGRRGVLERLREQSFKVEAR